MKVYNETSDPIEKNEDMERMREEVLREVDRDHDLLVSLDEFVTWTKSTEFTHEDKEEWKVRLSQFSCNSYPFLYLMLAHSSICACACVSFYLQTVEDKQQFTDEEIRTFEKRFKVMEQRDLQDSTPLPRLPLQFGKAGPLRSANDPRRPSETYDYIEYEDYAEYDPNDNAQPDGQPPLPPDPDSPIVCLQWMLSFNAAY